MAGNAATSPLDGGEERLIDDLRRLQQRIANGEFGNSTLVSIGNIGLDGLSKQLLKLRQESATLNRSVAAIADQPVGVYNKSVPISVPTHWGFSQLPAGNLNLSSAGIRERMSEINNMSDAFQPRRYVEEDRLNLLFNNLVLALQSLPVESHRFEDVYRWMISHDGFHLWDSVSTNHAGYTFARMLELAEKQRIIWRNSSMIDCLVDTASTDEWKNISQAQLQATRDILQVAFHVDLVYVADSTKNRFEEQSEDAEEIDQICKIIVLLEARAENGDYDLPLRIHDIHQELMAQGHFLPGDKGEYLKRTLQLAKERRVINSTGNFVRLFYEVQEELR
ncbi:hypothetical protein QFC19_003895 [Naganishia cerealis]|uniref:Uncharacterized protein n=1 Tax=Naganishia cerealis TaxID=610337 RepID=A0ACC2VZ51_9TREE|nr:hypothetical protein QFC19_003895 [Naganishia cerealis]